MFSFHKPRVYRSVEGCCICRAKSSSSRFTDSKKYEYDSIKCFNLKEPRHGEICNACVLLVKRFKRLPNNSNRHWGHVVDARAGPGTKSLTKNKKSRDDHTDGCSSSNSGKHTQSSRSLIQEKFSKIFKKTKKSQQNGSAKHRVSSDNSKHNGQPWDSLPSTPDSLESDYEDVGFSAPSSSGTVVEFQTQTRASAYRSRINAAQELLRKSGSKRRKRLPPVKNRRAVDKAQFFDKDEWQERKSCCGIYYECAELSNTVLIDMDLYKPCLEHRKKKRAIIPVAPFGASVDTKVQSTIIATAPAIVQLAPPATPIVNANCTPVLKKHHLFYKRQSECFPHGDINIKSNSSSSSSIVTTSNKTEFNAAPNNTTTTTIVGSSSTIASLSSSSSSSSLTGIATATVLVSTSTVSTPMANNIMNYHPTSFVTSSNISFTTASMPRHSTARIVTVSPTQSVATHTTTTALTPTAVVAASHAAKSQKHLHKVRSDTGKIVKHSLEKFNTAVCIKPYEMHEMKNVVKPVDKSYVLSKQPNQLLYHGGMGINQAMLSATTIVSPNINSSSSLATKFSDNSSDSGFDENVQDRKSVSPLHEEIERKPYLPVERSLKMMGGTNGECIAVGALDRLTEKQHGNVKILNTIGGGSQAKIRAIYNNNAIKHENGVTTIVPASSLAATTQTAAMNALAPSTVTITPAPAHNFLNGPIGNLNIKKMSAANLIGINGCSGLTTNTNGSSSNNTTRLTPIGNNVTATSLNQKIILVKTTKYNGTNNGNIGNTTGGATIIGGGSGSIAQVK